MGRRWLWFALAATLFHGSWGALIEIPEKAGFPATLGYAVWALTMMPCALIALAATGWRLDRDARSILLGGVVGLTGAGGQLLLFQALRRGPAYLVFPFIAVYPVVTVVLSAALLKERASPRAWIGIALAIVAVPLCSYQPNGTAPANGKLWLLLAAAVFLCWGVQGFFLKFANQRMRAESIFFYMALSGMALIPAAVGMTDFTRRINWGLSGPYLAAAIQALNSVGALLNVNAVRFGKAIIVIPMTALAPVLTIVISLAIYGVMPHGLSVAGIALATTAIYLMSGL